MADGQHKPNQDDLFALLGTPAFEKAMAARLGAAKQQPNPATKPARANAQRTVQEVLEELHPEAPEKAPPITPLEPTPVPKKESTSDRTQRITYFTAQHLSAIHDAVQQMQQQGLKVTTALDLAERTGITIHLVRNALLTLGTLGNRGHGFVLRTIATEISRVLHLNRTWSVALFGDEPSIVRYLGQDPTFTLEWFEPQSEQVGDVAAKLVARGIDLVVVAATAFDEAQRLALASAHANVQGLVNASGHHLVGLPDGFPVEPLNIATAFRRVSFLAGGRLPVDDGLKKVRLTR